MSGQEYRVTWQREGTSKKRAYYQTHEGALTCAERQRTAREDMTWLDDPESSYSAGRPAEITFGPIIEARSVGEWELLS